MKIHDNYTRLTVTERNFVDDTARRIMREFQKETFLPYGLLGDDRAEVFVEAFATWLTESAQEQGLKRYASGIAASEKLPSHRALDDEELIWGLEVA